MDIPSYPKITHIGHRNNREMFKLPVHVQEKVDGSQFSFMLKDDEVVFRSKGAQIYPGNVQKLFQPSVATVLSVRHKLTPGHIYRGEALHAPKHNTLCYGRVPKGNIALFDVQNPFGNFEPPRVVEGIAEELGVEAVPTYDTKVVDLEYIKEFLENDSFLGGVKVEGVVFKNYDFMSPMGEIGIAKLVCEGFKEKNHGEFRTANPTKKDIIEQLKEQLCNENRWVKAIQYLRDSDKLTDSVKDIGPLISRIQEDVMEEEEEWIKNRLFMHFRKDLQRGSVLGFPDWYKKRLLESAFE